MNYQNKIFDLLEYYLFSFMGILKGINYTIKKIDFFYSRDLLRYEDEEDYKTLTGGIVSIGIIVAIVIGFASMILDTLSLTEITTSIEVIKNVTPPPSTLQITPQSSFRFGVQIKGVNLSDTKRYLDVTLKIDRVSHGIAVNPQFISLHTCTKEYFASYPHIVTEYEKMNVSGWLCPPLNTTLTLQGKHSSDDSSRYLITVEACKNGTDPFRPCHSPSQIQTFFDQNKDKLYFTLYYSNPEINPYEKVYKSYYLQDQTYTIFGSQLGSETNLYFTDYKVETDDSIWPYEHTIIDQGCIVEQTVVNHNFQTNINGTFVVFNFAKSTNSINYQRTVQKLSSVFSYIGGMIGAVSAVLFILKLYTNMAFQFSISFEIFRQKSNAYKQEKNIRQSAT